MQWFTILRMVEDHVCTVIYNTPIECTSAE